MPYLNPIKTNESRERAVEQIELFGFIKVDGKFDGDEMPPAGQQQQQQQRQQRQLQLEQQRETLFN